MASTYRSESIDSSYYRDVQSFSLNGNLTNELSAAESELIKVYLRVRNRTNEEIGNQLPMIDYVIKDDKHLILKASKDVKSKMGQCSHRFTFTKIFDRIANQEVIFQTTTKHLIEEFLGGHNRLIFNYGVTNAGKTYTMQGDVNEPGIIPRSLDFCFSQLANKLHNIPLFKPSEGGLIKLSFKDAAKEMQIKTEILKMDLTASIISLSSTLNSTRVTSNSGEYISSQESSLRSTISEYFQGSDDGSNCKYSVWTSFVEIYSEQIFDLLGSFASKSKKMLKLRESESGISFLQGATEIAVNSSEEAYKLLLAGQQVLRRAATKLNQSSSRSHCIFTIKLVKTINDDISTAKINQLSFCDLAGSERSAKTQNVGERLREAGIINTSLMVLGRCIKDLRHNQTSSPENQVLVPFRESKITRMFKTFLTGHGMASMLINVSPCCNMFDETFNVLKFSAMAKELSLPLYHSLLKEKVTKSSINKLRQSLIDNRGSIAWEISSETCQDTVKDINEDNEKQLEKAMETIELLKEHIIKLNSEILQQEIDLRDELCTSFAEQLKETENYYRDRIIEEQELAEEMMERRLKHWGDYYRAQIREDVVMADASTQIEFDSSEKVEDSKEEKIEDCKAVQVESTKCDVSVEVNLLKLPMTNSCHTQTYDLVNEQDTESEAEISTPNCSKKPDRISAATFYSVINSSPSSLSGDDAFKIPEPQSSSVAKLLEMRSSDDTNIIATLNIVTDIQTKVNSLTEIFEKNPKIAEPTTSPRDSLVVGNNEAIISHDELNKLKIENMQMKQELEDIKIQISESDKIVQTLKDEKEDLIKQLDKFKSPSNEEKNLKRPRKGKRVSEDALVFNQVEIVTSETEEDETNENKSLSKLIKKRKLDTPKSKKSTAATKASRRIKTPVADDEFTEESPKLKVRKQLRRYNKMVESLSPLKSPEEPRSSVHTRVVRNLRKRK